MYSYSRGQGKEKVFTKERVIDMYEGMNDNEQNYNGTSANENMNNTGNANSTANNAANGHEILRNVADKICRANPRCYASIEDGIEVAKQNLQCFLQFYPEHVSDKARVYYGLVRT